MYDAISRKKNYLPLPSSAQDLVLPENCVKTTSGENFLLHDSTSDGKRILIFGTAKSVTFLRNHPHWCLDGTFKVVPEIFVQLYTIHAVVDHHTIPCIYALLPDKTQITYNKFIQEVENLTNCSPVSAMIDFERAMLNALIVHFPETDVKGCFFHLCQNIYRKIQEFGFQKQYQDNNEFSLKMRMIAALAFIPPESVQEASEELCDIMPEESLPILDYFEDHYIGRPCRRGRREPTFSIPLWNMYARTNDELNRTNNSVEGWHRSFVSFAGCSHPVIWKFLSLLEREINFQDVQMTQITAGIASEPPRKKYKDAASRITSIVQTYQEKTYLDYLRGIAFNLGF